MIWEFWKRGKTGEIKKITNLVNHVCQQTLHLIPLNLTLAFTLEPNSSHKLQQRDSSASNPSLALLPSLLEAARDENFPKQIPQRDVASAFQSQIYPALDEFVFARTQRGVEAGEVAATNAAA